MNFELNTYTVSSAKPWFEKGCNLGPFGQRSGLNHLTMPLLPRLTIPPFFGYGTIGLGVKLLRILLEAKFQGLISICCHNEPNTYVSTPLTYDNDVII